MYTSLASADQWISVWPKRKQKETPGVPSHLRNWILSTTTFGFVFVLTATAKPIQNVTNPYTAKQVQSMLHPSASAIPYPFLQSRASSTIERLLGPQLKKLKAMERD